MSLDKSLEAPVSEQTVQLLREKAKEKIDEEKWVGRDAELKAFNFVQCWTSEKAWGGILDRRVIKNEWAGMYVGDAEHAPPNYKVWIKGNETTLGIRSRTLKDLAYWKQVPYPDDRFRLEKKKIHDYIIAASVDFRKNNGAIVCFYGACAKLVLIEVLKTIERVRSLAQQEYFRPIPLGYFNYDLMLDMLGSCDVRSSAV